MVIVPSLLGFDRREPVELVQRLTFEHMVRLLSGISLQALSLSAVTGLRGEPLGGADAAPTQRLAGTQRLHPHAISVTRSGSQAPARLRSEEDNA